MERGIAFAQSPLIGVLTAPENEVAERPVVVFLNAGLVHHVGPNRLHVRLARELARRGFTSFRFDLSGIGDSLPRGDGASVHDARRRDVTDALDHLSATLGVRSFVLVGLCSGADLAFRASLAEPRIVGLVLIDGFPYPTRRGRLYRATRSGWSRLHHANWHRLLARDGPLLRRAHRSRAVVMPVERRRDVPTREQAESDLLALIDRGVRLLVAYTPDRDYTYPRHFAHAFPRVQSHLISVEYFKNADHTFTLQANQQLLLNAVTGWIACFE